MIKSLGKKKDPLNLKSANLILMSSTHQTIPSYILAMNLDFFQHFAEITNIMLKKQHNFQGKECGASKVEQWKDNISVSPLDLIYFRNNTISAGTLNWPDRSETHQLTPGCYPPTQFSRTVEGNASLFNTFINLNSRLVGSDNVFMKFLANEHHSLSFGAQLTDILGFGLTTDASIRAAYYALRVRHLLYSCITDTH